MTDLDLTEAIERANEAIAEQGGFWLDGDVVIAAIVPVIERQVRERIAADLLAVILSVSSNTLGVTEKQELILNGLRQALSIVRGGAS